MKKNLIKQNSNRKCSNLLNKIWLISLIPKFWNLSDRVRKEQKILLWNPNLYNAYSKKTDIWILRESFLFHK